MEGVELSAKFALMPNSLGHCGTDWFAGLYDRYLRGKASAWQLKAELRNFTAHFNYLKLIADCNGMRPFDMPVVEAFWLGNELLGNVGKRDLQGMITMRFVESGMAIERARRIAGNIPEGAVPHHSFHVLYVGSITGKFKPSLALANKCLARPARIREVRGEVAKAECWSVSGATERRSSTETVLLSLNGIRPEKFEKGDLVGLHWGLASAKISEAQARNAVKYTEKNLALVKEIKKENTLAVPSFLLSKGSFTA
ncbi:Uncharacterised protein [uncultured archaeon]|nr:Uncharacterised protein [uncultured archaeon]